VRFQSFTQDLSVEHVQVNSQEEILPAFNPLRSNMVGAIDGGHWRRRGFKDDQITAP